MVYKRVEVELEDGRIVSKQRAYILSNQAARDKSNEYKRKYMSKEESKQKHKIAYSNFMDRFEKEHGMPYHKWYRENNNKNAL